MTNIDSVTFMCYALASPVVDTHGPVSAYKNKEKNVIVIGNFFSSFITQLVDLYIQEFAFKNCTKIYIPAENSVL
jgi:hypothetical protein